LVFESVLFAKCVMRVEERAELRQGASSHLFLGDGFGERLRRLVVPQELTIGTDDPEVVDAMPVDRCSMLEAPICGHPPWPPRL
jgi:hypothetical protein